VPRRFAGGAQLILRWYVVSLLASGGFAKRPGGAYSYLSPKRS